MLYRYFYRVIVLSSSEAEHDIARAYDVHANGYLVKPMEFGKFYQMLEEVCSYWSKWNTLAMSSASPSTESPD